MGFTSDNQNSVQRVFTETLVKLGDKYKNFVVLNANVGTPLNIQKFTKVFPERHFNFGNAGRAMVGAAAGFVARRKTPFLCSYAVAATGRGFDSIRSFLCKEQLNLKIVGINSGIFNAREGSVNQALEDMAIMRTIPNMKVVCPADSVETASAVEAMMLDYGPTYLRLMHNPLPNLYDENYNFEFGQGNIYKQGEDVCIFAIGTCVHTALDAASILERKGLSTMVVNMSSLSPFDEDLVVECARAVQYVVTVEDHNVVGGLGSAVCEVLCDKYPIKVLRLGMDGFGESGKVDDLFRKYGLDGEGIAERVLERVGM
jgi:transketolase